MSIEVTSEGQRGIDIAAEPPWFFWTRTGEVTTPEEMRALMLNELPPAHAHELTERLFRARQLLASAITSSVRPS
jgi:hypothetical protein